MLLLPRGISTHLYSRESVLLLFFTPNAGFPRVIYQSAEAQESYIVFATDLIALLFFFPPNFPPFPSAIAFVDALIGVNTSC